ncbi:MAG TPA: alpha/beta fold hydrolase [Solirubrobacteraceae bacterium]
MRARSTLAALAAAAAVLGLTPAAHAAISYAPCEPAGYQCGQLPVPLDRTGAVPGTLTLSIKRAVATSNPTASAVVGLAGGPGQAALPSVTEFASILGPVLTNRDLVIFDQRGTGASGRLRCAAFESGFSSITEAAASCASQLGPARGFFRSADSVDDIESIRVESGYQKLVLFGVSYGTKVALDYAAKYPANVEAIVLDSVVPPEGSDVLNVSTFKALPRALGELCGNGLCNGITNNVGRDLATVARRAGQPGAGGRPGFTGKVNTPGGTSVRLRLTRDGLLEILLAGDLNPTLRAELPAALRSTIKGDRRPLLRLRLRAAGLTGIPNTRAQTDTASDSDALFVATRCEESIFPWDRNAPARQRAAQAVGAAQAHPATDFGAFGWSVALRSEAIPVCLGWPNASPPPAPPLPLPAVPTLVLTGGGDVRTPVEDAQAVASRIPGAQILAVPYTGHSVLTSDVSDCAKNAMAAFFTGQPVTACANPRPIIAPTPIAPTRLSRLPGRTRASKTVAAASATVRDVRLQFLGDELAAGRITPVGARVGGLRSGRATATSRGYSLRRVEFVPGVTVTGLVPVANGNSTLTISGRVAPHGRLTFHPDGSVTGRLGGRKVSIRHVRAAQLVTRGVPIKVPRHARRLQLG